jgi:8-oxo-dGTP diphosphatase
MSSGVSTAGLLQKDDRFLLALRKPGGAIGKLWEFPGGKAEPGETPPEALVREWKEELETGITVGELVCSGRFKHFEKEYTLLAYRVTTTDVPTPGPEHQSIGWFVLEEMENLAMPDSDRIIVEALVRYRSRQREWHSSE